MSSLRQARLTGMANAHATIDDYIVTFPSDVQHALREIRSAMHAAVPNAGETISYNIPTITLDGRPLVHFAGWKRHVSVYPIPDGDEDDQAALAPHRSGASTAKFMLDEPLPVDLIARIATLLVGERVHRSEPRQP